MPSEKTVPYRLMSIFAHPDDETFGSAGVLGRAAERGADVVVVSATRGEEGEIADPGLATPANLGQVREQELRNAMRTVGVTQVFFLDYRDGHLNQAEHQEAVGRIVWLLRRHRPDIVLTFSDNGMYGHPDHIAIHHLTLAAIVAAADPAAFPGLPAHQVTKVYYSAVPREGLLQLREQMRAQGQDFVPGGNAATIPVEAMGNPDETITTRVVLSDEELQRKVLAMRAHATQTPADSPFTAPDAQRIRLIMGTEYFILAPAPFTQGNFTTPETEIDSGLR